MKKYIAIVAALLAIAGCKSTKTLLPNVSGKAGEVIVVMDKNNWESAVGNATRELLACDCPWLAQQEPLYSLVNITPEGFADLFKIHRNIVLFNINPQADSTGVFYRQDMWSTPQCVIQVLAKDSGEAVQLLNDLGQNIVNGLEQAERDRVIRNSIRYEEAALGKEVSEVFGGTMHFPFGYKMKKKTDDFIWIADDKQYVYQDILIYKYPADEGDGQFTAESIISHRNEVMKENIPGMLDGSYMTTSDFFEPKIEYIKYKGRQFTQTRGMWEVQNDYMGGPFVSHSFYSPDGKDIIVTEAFVYAPRYDKRQYLRQVESILYSWEWTKNNDQN